MKKLLLALFAGVASLLSVSAAGTKTITVNDICNLVDEDGNRYGMAYTVYYGNFTYDFMPYQTYGDCKLTPVPGYTDRIRMTNFCFAQLGTVDFQLNSDNTLTLLSSSSTHPTTGRTGTIGMAECQEKQLYGYAKYFDDNNIQYYDPISLSYGYPYKQYLWAYHFANVSGQNISNPITDFGNNEYDIQFNNNMTWVNLAGVTGEQNPLYFDEFRIHTYTPNGTASYTVNGPSTGNSDLVKTELPTRVNLGDGTLNFVNFANRGTNYESYYDSSDELMKTNARYFYGTWAATSDPDVFTLSFPRQETWGDPERTVSFYDDGSYIYTNAIILTDSRSSNGYNEYYAQPSAYDTGAISGTMTLKKPVHKNIETNQWIHFQDGGNVHTMVGGILKINDFSVYRTNYDNKFTGYTIDCDDLTDVTHDVELGIETYGYGISGEDKGKYIYLRGALYPVEGTSTRYVDGYELMIVPGWHDSAAGSEFAHELGHTNGFNIEDPKYYHHAKYELTEATGLRHAVARRAAEGKTDEEIAAELNSGLNFNRMIPEADLPVKDPDGHYSIYVKTNYTPASGLKPTYHALSYVSDENTTSIDEVLGSTDDAVIAVRNGEIVVNGTDSLVEVFALSGAKVYSGAAGTIAVAPGIYLVKAGTQVKKVSVD